MLLLFKGMVARALLDKGGPRMSSEIEKLKGSADFSGISDLLLDLSLFFSAQTTLN